MGDSPSTESPMLYRTCNGNTREREMWLDMRTVVEWSNSKIHWAMIHPVECWEEMEDEDDETRRGTTKESYIIPFTLHISWAGSSWSKWRRLVDLTGGVVWTGERESTYKTRDFRTTAIHKSLRPTLLYNTQDCPCPSATSLLSISPPRAFPLHSSAADPIYYSLQCCCCTISAAH